VQFYQYLTANELCMSVQEFSISVEFARCKLFAVCVIYVHCADNMCKYLWYCLCLFVLESLLPVIVTKRDHLGTLGQILGKKGKNVDLYSASS